jgi:hypothetical protein
MSTWITHITEGKKIGEYQGYEVTLGDLSPDTEKFVNFPVKSSKDKVCMPLEEGVNMLYELFQKDYKEDLMKEGKSEYNAFGMFSVNICKNNFLKGMKKLLWNQYFWQEETIKLKAAGKLAD